MKFAIFGDIHANLEAFDAVMEDAKALGADQFVCIGDVVGYNANPHECVARLQELGCPVVKGNHDEEASATTEIVGLNPLAHAALEWTRRQLTQEDKHWLRNLRMVRQVRDFTNVKQLYESIAKAFGIATGDVRPRFSLTSVNNRELMPPLRTLTAPIAA